MRTVVLLALPLVLVSGPRLADACSCASVGVVQLLPANRDRPPLNTRLRVEIPVTDYLHAKNIKPEELRLTLRGPKNAAIPVDIVRYGSADERWVELLPKAPLLPATRYQVVIGVGGGNDGYLGHFTTGDTADNTAPTFAGVTRSAVVTEKPGAGRCATGEPHIVLTLGEFRDDATPAASLRFHVWLADDSGAIDYDAPPTTTAAARGNELWLGRASICTPQNLVLPERPRIKLGLKVVDLAGNASPPVEVEVSAEPRAKGGASDDGKASGEKK